LNEALLRYVLSLQERFKVSAYEAHYIFPLSESGFNYDIRLGEADQGTLYLPGLQFDYY
jgi:hypothetical protein